MGDAIAANIAADPGWLARLSLSHALNPPSGAPPATGPAAISMLSRMVPASGAGAPTPSYVPFQAPVAAAPAPSPASPAARAADALTVANDRPMQPTSTAMMPPWKTVMAPGSGTAVPAPTARAVAPAPVARNQFGISPADFWAHYTAGGGHRAMREAYAMMPRSPQEQALIKYMGLGETLAGLPGGGGAPALQQTYMNVSNPMAAMYGRLYGTAAAGPPLGMPPPYMYDPNTALTGQVQ